MNVIRMVHIHYLAVDSMQTVWIQSLVKVSVQTCIYVCTWSSMTVYMMRHVYSLCIYTSYWLWVVCAVMWMYVYALMPFLVCYVVLLALELEAAQILLCYIPYMICSQKKVSDWCSFQEDGSSAGNCKEWWKLSRVRRCTITICSVIHTFRDLL